ncbi:hypothetical protein F895_01009 [Acinetobacter sp. CIP 64.2]|uniref:GNAT family N-acetyltransferase n=1 Tax=unclassified Acinetobacter TaxID=196816 RepID=UPI000287CA66|nr:MULTISPECIES: GNAT family N-acetyltransferase [unclassified Acinetobacter]ENX17428.1 hypothetical protein F895_01009 [Acinetobacter sp. CIP 64.2]
MIRLATSSDLDQIVQLIRPYIIDFALNAEGADKFSQSMIHKLMEMPNIEYFVFEQNTQLMGVIAYRQPAHILHFFVDQRVQRQGIGRQLWQFLENKIATSHSSITVNSSCYAQVIYEKFGFTASSAVIEQSGLRFVPMHKSYA